MKVTAKGQVTIPARIRGYLGIRPHCEVEFTIREGEVVMSKAGERTVEQAQRRFASMRGILGRDLSTHEWMAATRGD